MVRSMDQEKIGKLIATLRKKHNMTQSELGAKVGVGDRAVSKWERGLTCPDISIINDLSKILGITTDELLAGELKDKKMMEEISSYNNKFNKRLLLIPLGIILILVGLILYINYNKSDVYTLQSASDEYDVVGKVIFKNNKMSLIINRINYRDKEFSYKMIKNYEYDVRSSDNLLYRIGRIDEHYLLLNDISIEELGNKINISIDIEKEFNKKQIIKNGLTFIITYFDENEHYITSNIEMILYK